MTDPVLGADPDHLDGLAEALSRGARQVASGADEVSSLASAFERSSPGTSVRVRWAPLRHDAARAAELLARAGGSVRGRARRQRAVSAPVDGAPAIEAGTLVVVASGDPLVARHLAVIVPGMGTSARDAQRLARDSERLRRAAGAADTAVVVWVGAATPAGWREAASDLPARTDGAVLARDVAALRRRSSGDVTVIGHSYGSTTVAWAARAGLDTDRLVALGSPGLGVEHVTELGLPASVPFYAAVSEGDPVSHLRWFGNDPTAPSFGARSFDAGVGRGHSGYFTPGSESLVNLARIVRGDEPHSRPATTVERWADALRSRSRAANDTVDELQARLGPAAARPEVEVVQLLERVGTRAAVAIGDLLDDWTQLRWG